MRATIRRLLLVSAGAFALSASGLAQVMPQDVASLEARYWAAARAFSAEDYDTARKEFEALASDGYSEAAYFLATIYGTGQGVPKDMAESIKWHTFAANLGNAKAQSALGSAYQQGLGVAQNLPEAARWYRLAGEQGDAVAQYSLGWMHRSGEGVPRNYAEAVRLFRLAAYQGNGSAQFTLGVMYASGEGVTQNNEEAVDWYLLAAHQGDIRAQYNLGLMYDNGQGVTQNYVEAIHWYKLAAEQGHASAQYNLAQIYLAGDGVAPNDAEALRWYRLAAEQGYPNAQFNLGVMYVKGRGVPQNDVEAYKWWSIAAAQGHNSAASYRETVRGNMTPDQIAEGQRLAAAWKPSAAAYGIEPEASVGKAPAATRIASTGSGFYVTAAGHILTNAHVVEGCASVSLAGDTPLTLIDVDLGSDLALLKKGGASSTTPLMLRQGRGVRLADSVVVAGLGCCRFHGHRV